MKYVLLSQTDSSQALGISVNKFISSYKTKFKNNGLEHAKKRYYIPFEQMTEAAQQKYSAVVYDDEVDQVLQQLAESVDFTGQKQAVDLAQARRRKIIKQTQYIDQKIQRKKEQLFDDWSERFFVMFEKTFQKFKTKLINLHLNTTQVQELTQILDISIKELQGQLKNIHNDYINNNESNEQMT